MINRYRDYLEFIDNKLKKMFESQSVYIKCKKGCSLCCKEGEFPMSELEFVYMMLAYMKLSNSLRETVDKQIRALLESNADRLYSCPFLINDECSIYQGRPIICRTFGLIYYNKKERFKVPFCVDLGLNYSDVYNKDTEKIDSAKLIGNTQISAFNIERSVLRSKKIERSFELFFGEDKRMADWLEEEFK